MAWRRRSRPYRPLRHMREPATLDGGDVLRVGQTIFVGLSPRTNQAGVAQLAAELEPFGYTVRAVPVRGALHFKTACSYVGDNTLLVNRAWIDAASLDWIQIDRRGRRRALGGQRFAHRRRRY